MSAVSAYPSSLLGTKSSSKSEVSLTNSSNILVTPVKETAVSRQATISWLVLNIIALVILVIGVIFVGISTLPTNVVMFSGAYFVIGSFFAFLTAGILVGSLIVVGKDTIQKKTPSIDKQSSTNNTSDLSNKTQPTELETTTTTKNS